MTVIMLAADWQQWLKAQPMPAPDTGAATLVHLADYGLLRFQGPDVQRFLLGYLTIDPARLARQPADDGSLQASPFAMCTLKGRVLVNGWCYVPEDEVVDLVIHRSLTARVPEFLKAYLAFSRTAVSDLSDERLLFACWPPMSHPGNPLLCLRLDDRHRLLVADRVAAAAALVETHGLAGAERWQSELVTSGLALVRERTSERYLPQMLDLDRLGAVSFDKGCYLGQEVVARAQHRGQVKRRLARLRWQDDGTAGASAPVAGETLRDARGRDCGEVVECAAGSHQCLAVLAQDAVPPLQCTETVTQSGVSLTLDPVP